MHLPEHDSPARGAFDALADSFAHGFAVLSRGGELLYANAALQALLATGDGLALDAQRLTHSEPLQAQRLATLLLQVACERGRANSMGLPRPSGRPAYGLLARGLGTTDDTGAAVIVYVSDAASRLDLPRELVQRVLGLTPAESGIAARLADGDDVDDIVSALGIRAATVRVHLRNIYRKLGISRQSDLVRLVLRTVAPLADS